MSAKTVTINPITRLEGYSKIRIFLNEDGNSERLFSSSELKDFERLCEERKAENIRVTMEDEILKTLEEKRWKECTIQNPTLLPRLIKREGVTVGF
jgi:hypothetical protein